MVQLLVRSVGQRLICRHVEAACATQEELVEAVASVTGIGAQHFWLRVLSVGGDWVEVSVCGRLLGGKGGFGTLLKGQRGRKRKTKNFDACRTLDGTRLGVAQKEKRIAAWKEKQEREEKLIDILGGEDLSISSRQRRQPIEPRAIVLPKANVEAETTRIIKEAAQTAAATATAYAAARKTSVSTAASDSSAVNATIPAGFINELLGDGTDCSDENDDECGDSSAGDTLDKLAVFKPDAN